MCSEPIWCCLSRNYYHSPIEQAYECRYRHSLSGNECCKHFEFFASRELSFLQIILRCGTDVDIRPANLDFSAVKPQVSTNASIFRERIVDQLMGSLVIFMVVLSGLSLFSFGTSAQVFIGVASVTWAIFAFLAYQLVFISREAYGKREVRAQHSGFKRFY